MEQEVRLRGDKGCQGYINLSTVISIAYCFDLEDMEVVDPSRKAGESGCLSMLYRSAPLGV